MSHEAMLALGIIGLMVFVRMDWQRIIALEERVKKLESFFGLEYRGKRLARRMTPILPSARSGIRFQRTFSTRYWKTIRSPTMTTIDIVPLNVRLDVACLSGFASTLAHIKTGDCDGVEMVPKVWVKGLIDNIQKLESTISKIQNPQ